MIDTPLQILSLNANKQQAATENALLIATERKADIILIQEPWFHSEGEGWEHQTSTSHANYTQILPKVVPHQRPRTIAYISKTFSPSVYLAETSPVDGDIQILEIAERDNKIQIVNIYNQKSREDSTPRTFQRSLQNTPLYKDLILSGDFNSHHPWWSPRVETPNSDAEEIVEWFEDNELILLNKPGVPTFRRGNSSSVLDLALLSQSISQRPYNYSLLEDLVSDHIGCVISFQGTRDMVDNPLCQTRYNTKKADWALFQRTLQQSTATQEFAGKLQTAEAIAIKENALNIIQDKETDVTSTMDNLAQIITEAITHAADQAIPKIDQNPRAKAWWTEELKEMRSQVTAKRRQIVEGEELTITPYLHARNRYFQAVKKAKMDHWNQFLQKEDPKSIFKAMKYTSKSKVQRMPLIKDPIRGPQSTFDGKCKAFRTALFPPPPEATEAEWENYKESDRWEWPALTKVELEHACSSKIKSRSPGPDAITQDIITKAYEAIPDVFFKIYTPLINIGYHPAAWRQATGAILPKVGKPDYSVPKAFRIITLLNCLGKVSERIIAQRLGYLAETTDLLHHTQMGGRVKRSAIDAALLLKNEVETNKLAKMKTSTLFMDVKGAYDHVAKQQLFKIFQMLRLPLSLIAWVASFLSQRLLRLAFDGQIQEFAPNKSGVPQGSPVSPMLFLIYIRNLFKATTVKWISYVDDISLTACSKSIKKNTQILQREAAKLVELARDSNIAFDLEKTELLHWEWNKKSRDEKLTLPNGDILKPLASVKWLGIHFDTGLTFKHHVAIKVAKARNTFFRMSRLANLERGLTPFALRQLYTACVTSIADYGAIIWWKGQVNYTNKLQSLQNLSIRKILGVFRTAPISPMEVEAALPPAEIRINSTIRAYALRLKKLSNNHPINQEIHKTLHPQEEVNPRKHTQLKRIHKSISHLTEGMRIEKITPFYFPPWKRDTPYQVDISPLSKEEETKKHQNTAKDNPHNSVFIYTDASATSTKDSKGIGIGLAVLSPPSETIHKQISKNVGPNNLVYDGELEGATMGAEYANKIAKPGLQFHIYSDNQAGLWRLKTPSDNPGQSNQIRAIKAAKQIVEKGATITYHWVPGHKDISGNEIADALAKGATKMRPTTYVTSFAALGMQIKQMGRDEWAHKLEKESSSNDQRPTHYSYKGEFPWNLRSKLQVPAGTPREATSAFYQLKLGHGRFRDYLFRRSHIDHNLCWCGAKETPVHLLLSCKLYRKPRRRLKDSLDDNHPSIRTLLTTTKGVEATIEFLKATRIATRAWLLERDEWYEDGEL